MGATDMLSTRIAAALRAAADWLAPAPAEKPQSYIYIGRRSATDNNGVIEINCQASMIVDSEFFEKPRFLLEGDFCLIRFGAGEKPNSRFNVGLHN